MPTTTDAQVISIANGFKASLATAEGDSVETMVLAWLRMQEALEADLAALVEILAEKESLTVSQLLALDRYQDLLRDLESYLSDYETLIAAPQIKAMQALAGELGNQSATTMLRGITGQQSGYAVPATELEYLISQIQAGNPLATILDGIHSQTGIGLGEILVDGVLRGWSPRTMLAAAKAQGMGKGLNHALLVLRDQTNRAFRYGSWNTYRSIEQVIGWRWTSALNDRTCIACLSKDGEIHYGRGREMPILESHPQCRCTMIPVMENIYLPSMETGEDWFARQPVATQEAIMGKGTHQFWRSRSGMPFSALATPKYSSTWGEGWNPTPLYALKEAFA